MMDGVWAWIDSHFGVFIASIFVLIFFLGYMAASINDNETRTDSELVYAIFGFEKKLNEEIVTSKELIEYEKSLQNIMVKYGDQNLNQNMSLLIECLERAGINSALCSDYQKTVNNRLYVVLKSHRD